MATSPIPHRWKYDVFVSFRGEDIRKSFMDHMFNDFKQKGIHAFRDDRELPKGEEISPQLYKAIEESRFLIVVFSKNYASSTWCLRELVKILQRKQMGKPKHEVRIIFYDVKPNVVKDQTESYAEAFDKHKKLKRPEVDEWKKALSMAGNLSGWDLQDMTNGYEYKFIDCISKDILKKLCDGPLHVGENLVGIDFHFDKLNLSRFIGSHKVNMLGICGISGIGKTTLAKAIYNLMYVHFEGSCFFENLKEVEEKQSLTQVQMQMIGKILKTDDLKISSVGEGSMVIKQRLACKPILLVLDDVDDHEQLQALAGSPAWFCPGSLIIFTGKDKQLLRSHRVDGIYDMKFLDEDKSLELFYSFAFEKKNPSTGFKEVSEKVVKYVQGHPLALRVLGCFLYGKTMAQWVSELERLKVHPNEGIQRVLRLSYDGLHLQQRNILLDIACSFVGVNSDFAAIVLDGCNFSADRNMQVLVDKSLITISSNNSLQMHDLIQAMAREIVFEESCTLGNRSRLWGNPSEIYNILSENQATEVVEILDIQLKKYSQKFDIDGKAFARMKNLRILKLPMDDAVKFSGRLDFLSNKLRLLYWHGCPFKLLPSDFYPENIVAIDLSYSSIQNFWTTPKCFRRLKVMKLRYCCNLTTTPDFSEITNLEELSLEGCVNLVSVHPSIGMLERLVVLNLAGCLKVDQHPSFVSSLISLASLSFGGQGRIQPRWWTSISGFIWKQQHPQRSVSLAGLRMLKKLNLSYCNLEQVPESIGGLSCLERLHLEGNNFTSLPGSLSQLPHLQYLRLDGCKKLEVLPELPHRLDYINASDCTSLREVSVSSKDSFRKRFNVFRNCPKLLKNVTIDSQGSISKTQCLDSSITSQGSIYQLSAFLGSISLLIMATTSIPRQWKYDVFISFRGEDIRKNFMDYMFNDFKQKGIYAFRDDIKLPKGDEISPHLYKAIEESRFLIVIFSKNYASSSWCLRELVKILECKQMGKLKHEVQIFFYDVKPDLVRKQTGSYAEAFAKHQVYNTTEVDKWKEALSMMANLSIWDLQDMTNGFESKFINSISIEILKTLCDGPLHVSENLVGMDFLFDKLDLAASELDSSHCSANAINEVLADKFLITVSAKNVTIDSEGSISKTQCLHSPITSQGSIHQLSAILGYVGFPTNRCEFFLQDTGYHPLDIVYHGNSNIPEWFTNRSKGKHVKVELPSDWCYDKFRGFGTCIVFKRKKPFKEFKGYSVKNFDGASLNAFGYIPFAIRGYFENEVIGIQDSYMIWLHYTKKWEDWKEAKNFVTFCFEEDNEVIEVKEFGVRLICDEDLQQEEDVTNLSSMFQDLPTLSQHGGALSYLGPSGSIQWSW